MPPARLDHANSWIGEKINCALEQVRLRNKIGVENTDKLAFRGVESNSERTRFETSAIDAMNELDVEAATAQFVRARGGDLARIVGRIIQHLNLEKFSRIIQFADRAQQTLDHVNFVKDRQLHRHLRQLLKAAGRDRLALSVFEKEINDEIAMDAVGGQTDEHTQIADRPNNVTEASLHGASRSCRWLRQQGRHDDVSATGVKSKNASDGEQISARNAVGAARKPEHCPRFADGNRDALSTINL